MNKVLIVVSIFAYQISAFANNHFSSWKLCESVSTEQKCENVSSDQKVKYALSKGLTEVVYKSTFDYSKCNAEGCWLYLGEGADNVIVTVNGHLVFNQLDNDKKPFYSRYLSNIFFIPHEFLSQNNEIQIKVTDLNGTIFGINASNIDAGDFKTILELQFKDFFKRTGLTLLSAFSMLMFFVATLGVAILTRNLRFSSVSLYALSSAAYLISFSEVFRSYFNPVFTSGAFHFGLRLFQDLCLVLMIGFYFEKNKIKHLNKILLVYLVSISSLFLMWSFGLREYKFFLYLMYCFSPLIFFPMVYGFYYSSNLDKSDSTKKGLMFFFLLMMLVQINDLFSFWQIYNGFFFVRFYPNALILLFGLLYSRREIQKRLNLEKNSLIFDLTQQVSHDIRSPLAALEMISGSLNELPEDKRLIIRNSINRIRDIANSLLDKNRANKNAFIETIPEELNESPATALPSEEFTTILLSPLVDSIVTEKRIQYRNHIGVRIEFNQTVASYGLFASIQPNEFQRVLSNLINNAVEAFPNHEGLVEIVMQSDSEGLIEIVIKDNGKGIPESIIAKLGTRGETHGKEGGSGLGIFHAKQTVESFKGSLKIESKPSQGTVISIHLPREVEQKWFVPKISIAANQTIIVFDDDQSIHQIWDGRLASLPGYESLVVHHFSGPAEIRKFYGKNFIDLDEALFLMDYEIGGSNETGLDVIESLGIQNQSILVTSRYEEKAIRQRCDQLGVKLIPKSMSGFVPMEIV